MLLITSSWGANKTFKMIPATPDCVYNEAIFDLDSKVLALISKEKKESLHMVAKVNEWGDVVPMKIGKRSNGKDYAEERKSLETFYEYYIENAEEVKDIVSRLAVNADTFDITSFVEAKTEAPKVGNLISTI
jgi:HD-GYP domain-containing protein (c-di-GMP phosphodiesterase class II)